MIVFEYVCAHLPAVGPVSMREKGAVFNLTDPGQGRLSHMPNIRALAYSLSLSLSLLISVYKHIYAQVNL